MSEKSEFVFSPVSFDAVLSEINEDALHNVHRLKSRWDYYCPEKRRYFESIPLYPQSLLHGRDHEHDDEGDEDDVSKPSSIGTFRKLFSRCSAISTLQGRSDCRNNVQTKCLSTLPGMSSLCNNLPPNKKKSKNCDSLKLRSEKKQCLREKRQQCKLNVATRHPDWPFEDIVQKCKDANKKLQRCLRQKVTKEKLSVKMARKICRKKTKKKKTKKGRKNWVVQILFTFIFICSNPASEDHYCKPFLHWRTWCHPSIGQYFDA